MLTQAGDIKVEWDPADPDSVAKAREEFDRLKADGYNFYEAATTKSKQVTRFSKTAGTLLAAPGARREVDRKRGTRQRAMAGGPLSTSRATAISL